MSYDRPASAFPAAFEGFAFIDGSPSSLEEAACHPLLPELSTLSFDGPLDPDALSVLIRHAESFRSLDTIMLTFVAHRAFDEAIAALGNVSLGFDGAAVEDVCALAERSWLDEVGPIRCGTRYLTEAVADAMIERADRFRRVPSLHIPYSDYARFDDLVATLGNVECGHSVDVLETFRCRRCNLVRTIRGISGSRIRASRGPGPPCPNGCEPFDWIAVGSFAEFYVDQAREGWCRFCSGIAEGTQSYELMSPPPGPDDVVPARHVRSIFVQACPTHWDQIRKEGGLFGFVVKD